MRTEIWNLLGHLHSDFYQLLPLCSRTGFPMSLLRTTKRVTRSKPGISLWKWPLSLLVLSRGHCLHSPPPAHVPSPHREDHLWGILPSNGDPEKEGEALLYIQVQIRSLSVHIAAPRPVAPCFLVIYFSFNHLCSHESLGHNPSSLQIARF